MFKVSVHLVLQLVLLTYVIILNAHLTINVLLVLASKVIVHLVLMEYQVPQNVMDNHVLLILNVLLELVFQALVPHVTTKEAQAMAFSATPTNVKLIMIAPLIVV